MEQASRNVRAFALTITLATIGSLSATVALSQEDLLRYFPMVLGDFWTFDSRLPSGTPETPLAFFLSSEEVAHSGQAAVRRDQSNGNFQLQRWDHQGLWLESVHLLGDIAVQFQEPALLLPARLEVGGQHRVEVNYRTVSLDLETDRGIQVFEVSRLPDASVMTLAGTFEHCLVTTTKALRTGEDGASRGYTLTEWRAPGVGLVKMEGESFSNDPSGQRTSTKPIDVVLSGALVNGQPVEDSGTRKG